MSGLKGVIELDSVENNLVRAGIGYWRQVKGNRAYPSRQQIVPREISGLMRNVVLVRVLDGGEDFEFRIFGDAHTQAATYNMQGGQLRDVKRVWPELAESLHKVYTQVVQTRQPVAVRTIRDDCPGLNPLASENVLLPLGKDDTKVDHILVFSVYESTEAEATRAAE